MDRSAEWTQRYGADASMEWSKYVPVNPATFAYSEYAGKSPAPEKK
jgi:hypothetical protein